MSRHYVVTQGRYSDYRILGVFDTLAEAMPLVEKACAAPQGLPHIEVWDGTQALHEDISQRTVYTAYIDAGSTIDIYEHTQRTAPMRARAIPNDRGIRAIGTDRVEVLKVLSDAYLIEYGRLGHHTVTAHDQLSRGAGMTRALRCVDYPRPAR